MRDGPPGISMPNMVSETKYRFGRAAQSLTFMLETCGDGDQSRALIESALQRMRRCGNEKTLRQIQALEALLHLRRGDLPLVSRWAEMCGLGPDDGPDYTNELAHTTLGRWLFATGDGGGPCRCSHACNARRRRARAGAPSSRF